MCRIVPIFSWWLRNMAKAHHLLNKQSICKCFEIWRHSCDVTIMLWKMLAGMPMGFPQMAYTIKQKFKNVIEIIKAFKNRCFKYLMNIHLRYFRPNVWLFAEMKPNVIMFDWYSVSPHLSTNKFNKSNMQNIQTFNPDTHIKISPGI